MLRRASIIGICFCIFSLNLFAQDRPASAEELFYCYPADSYESISFMSNDLPKDEESYRFYRWMMRQLLQAQQKYFDNDISQNQNKTSLFNGMRYSTSATILHARFIEFDMPREYEIKEMQSMIEKLREEYKYGSPVQWFDNEKQKIVVYGVWINDRSMLQVYHMDDVQASIKAALAEGTIADTGEVRHGRHVFSFSRHYGSESKDYLVWATETGELMMADSAEYLNAMISTVYDGQASILSQREYVDAFEMIPDLGNTWSIHFQYGNSKFREKQLEYITDKRTRKFYEESINSGPLYFINSRTIADTYMSTSIEVYENEEFASKALEGKKLMPDRYKRMLNRPNMPDNSKENIKFQIYRAENTIYKQDGTAVIGMMTYDRKYVKEIEKLYKTIADYKQKQEEKTKNNQNEEKK